MLTRCVHLDLDAGGRCAASQMLLTSSEGVATQLGTKYALATYTLKEHS